MQNRLQVGPRTVSIMRVQIAICNSHLGYPLRKWKRSKEVSKKA